MLSSADIAKTIDHALLRPDATAEDLEQACRTALEYNVATVCVRPCDVQRAVRFVKGSDVKVSTVVAFPHGGSETTTKIAETLKGIEDGALELDMVLNIGRLRSGDEAYVEQDVAAVVMAARRKGIPIKVILETCYLTREQIRTACAICKNSGAEFVKTSTGFGTNGADIENVRFMVKSAEGIKVKASGGIRTLEQALAFLAVGASRLGTASTEEIMKRARELESGGELQEMLKKLQSIQ